MTVFLFNDEVLIALHYKLRLSKYFVHIFLSAKNSSQVPSYLHKSGPKSILLCAHRQFVRYFSYKSKYVSRRYFIQKSFVYEVSIDTMPANQNTAKPNVMGEETRTNSCDYSWVIFRNSPLESE
jgi:hypothetical protein